MNRVKLPEYNEFKNGIPIENSIVQIWCDKSTAEKWMQIINLSKKIFSEISWTKNNKAINHEPDIEEIVTELKKHWENSAHFAIRLKSEELSMSGHFFAGETLMFGIENSLVNEDNYFKFIGFVSELSKVTKAPIKVYCDWDEEEYGSGSPKQLFTIEY